MCPELAYHELEWHEAIGSGHTCEVFRATYRGDEVAIKYLAEFDGQSDKDETLAREIATMCMVRHRNIVRFYGVVTSQPPIKIVMEYCKGGSLYELLHRQRDVKPTWSQLLKIAYLVAGAMNYLHEFDPGIIHRDLKSLNILLHERIRDAHDTPDIRLADFGLARMLDGREPLTQGVGTNRWMAPEILCTQSYDDKIDVYSFAMLLYEITCRKIPFGSAQDSAIRQLVLGGARPDLCDIAPECPPGMQNLIAMCWAGEPRDRPSFKEIAKTIGSMMTESVVVSL